MSSSVAPAPDILVELGEIRQEVDGSLDRLLPGGENAAEQSRQATLHRAMRYSLFAGGKRVRPALTILAGELLGADRQALLAPAAALEMVHCFSLIHDDLPALDDDDLRRGKPSLHRAFDEAVAILAGDALLNLALEVLARHPEALPAERRIESVLLATDAIGARGMIGGQMADLEGSTVPSEEAEQALLAIHRGKTGALLAASLMIGANCALADQGRLKAMGELGHHIGLLFQIRDDLLDVEGSAETLGKTPGKDVDASKLTYPALFGLEGSRERLEREASASIQALRGFEDNPARASLEALVNYLVERDH